RHWLKCRDARSHRLYDYGFWHDSDFGRRESLHLRQLRLRWCDRDYRPDVALLLLKHGSLKLIMADRIGQFHDRVLQQCIQIGLQGPLWSGFGKNSKAHETNSS